MEIGLPCESMWLGKKIQPLASWATRMTLPCTIGKLSKTDADLVPKSLMRRSVIPKSGYMAKEAVVSSDV